MISSLWRNPLNFWSFWLPKIGVSLFLASFVFFFKRNYWTIVVALFIDTWMLANIFYLRSTHVLFDGFTFTMASNMDGFWSSLLALIEWKDIIPYSLTIIYAIALIILNKFRHNIAWRIGVLITILSILINWFAFALVKQFSMVFYGHTVFVEKHNTFYYLQYNPFSYEYRQSLQPMNKNYGFDNFSVVHGWVYVMLDYLHNLYEMENPYQLTEEEINEVVPFMGTNKELTYNNLLLIVIVESLETWAIDDRLMPNLSHFIDTHNVLHAKYLKSQISGGASSDGQLIVNTGLLPIQQGATCFRYPYITFPSVVNRKDSAATLLTHSAYCWNQIEMSKAYGYDFTQEGSVEDSILSTRIIDFACRDFTTIQAITIATHIPFKYANQSKLTLPNDMPSLMSDYLKCMNWTDEGLGVFLNYVDSISQLKNATIVITGDHTIFWKDKRDQFSQYCMQNDLDYDVQKGYVPLIIYSPAIEDNITIDEECYQMDIYPTILSLIGADDYYWRGFGVNLLDSTARHNRPITEEEAYILSDKLIRSNYFEKYSSNN